ncbi:hypothetical protein PMAYCL1PPCAC_27372, partial [Pristionchus mayeri]
IVRTIKERIEEMGKKIEGKERAEKEGEHLEEVQLGIHGSSNLPLNASVDHEEKLKMDQEAALLTSYDDYSTRDFIESCFDSLHSELYKSREEIKSLKEDLNYLKAHVSNESKIIKNELGSMSLSLSAILSNTTQPSPNHSHSISTPHTPRISIAPRSQFRTPNSLDRPTHSRDRSRSPIAPRTNPISKPSHIAQTVKCTFCNSTIHYSRNCSHVTSISTRLSLMAPNQCLRC